MNLAHKQEYFEYRGGWSYKQPPRLDHAIHRRLREIDPAYHLIWGGVAVLRNEPDGDPVSVRGDMKGTKILFGRLTARWISARVKQFAGYSYQLKDGRERLVMRDELIPVRQRELAVAKFEYVDYGQLRWFLARHLTPEQLVEANIYQAETVPPEGDYIWAMTIQTPEKLYWEPDRAWLEMVAKSNYETFNTPLEDLYRRDHEIREQQLAAQEEEADSQTYIPKEEILKMSVEPERTL